MNDDSNRASADMRVRWADPEYRRRQSDAIRAGKAAGRQYSDELNRLRRDCAELYQVIGTMAEHCPDPNDPAIIKALDNASAAANGDPRPHEDLLPFILPEPARA